VARYFDEVGWQRWAYLAVGLVFVAATAIVPFLFMIHLGIAAVIVAIVLFAASIFPYAVMSL
jgi:membrane protein implicated in regulation of membrane protease activity